MNKNGLLLKLLGILFIVIVAVACTPKNNEAAQKALEAELAALDELEAEQEAELERINEEIRLAQEAAKNTALTEAQKKEQEDKLAALNKALEEAQAELENTETQRRGRQRGQSGGAQGDGAAQGEGTGAGAAAPGQSGGAAPVVDQEAAMKIAIAEDLVANHGISPADAARIADEITEYGKTNSYTRYKNQELIQEAQRKNLKAVLTVNTRTIDVSRNIFEMSFNMDNCPGINRLELAVRYDDTFTLSAPTIYGGRGSDPENVTVVRGDTNANPYTVSWSNYYNFINDLHGFLVLRLGLKPADVAPTAGDRPAPTVTVVRALNSRGENIPVTVVNNGVFSIINNW